MKCMFIGLSGKGKEQMVEGFNLDIEFPKDTITLPNEFKSMVEGIENPQLFIQLFNREYYINLERNNMTFNTIKNDSFKEFYNDFLLNKFEEKNIIKKQKL